MAGQIKSFLKCGSTECLRRHPYGTILTELADEGHVFDAAEEDPWNPRHVVALLFRSDKDTWKSMEPSAELASFFWYRKHVHFEYHPRHNDFRVKCLDCKRVWTVTVEELTPLLGDDVVLGFDAGRAIGA